MARAVRTIRLFTTALVAATLPGCDHPWGAEPAPKDAAALTKVSGDDQTGAHGDTLPEPLVVRATDSSGRPVAGVQVRWALTGAQEARIEPLVATTDAEGLVRARWVLAVGTGTHAATASVRTSRGPLSVTFSATAHPGPPATLKFRPPSLTIESGTTETIQYSLYDRHSYWIPQAPPLRWSSSDASVASVDSTGLVTGHSPGYVTVTGSLGELHATMEVTVAEPLRVTSFDAGYPRSTAVGANGGAYHWGPFDPEQAGSSTLATRIPWGDGYARVATGSGHACGIDTDGTAYCWGDNAHGQLGNGTTVTSSSAVAVAGGHQFRTLAASYHTCGITLEGELYCWGKNDRGQLGNGTTTASPVPVRVASDVEFTAVAVSEGHSCALSVDGDAYCWGNNTGGELGDGTTTNRSTPVPVAGGLRFQSLSTYIYTCGVATDSRAYCWGGGPGSQATDVDRSRPRLVAGDLRFRAISTGAHKACGVTVDGIAYCWGDNARGGLGTGDFENSAEPVPVATTARFTDIDSSFWTMTCALATDGQVHCWGSGYLGNYKGYMKYGPDGMPCGCRPYPEPVLLEP